MSELHALLSASAALRRRRRTFLLATVLSTRGSTYRRPGARLLLDDEGGSVGSVSAGCLESDLARRGWWQTAERPALLLTYDATSDDELAFGLGLGCDGAVDLLLERSTPEGPDPLAFHARCAETERPGALATLHRSSDPAAPAFSRLALDADGQVDTRLDAGPARAWLLAEARAALDLGQTRAARSPDGSLEALIEVIAPPPRLFVFGEQADAAPVAALARSLGWRVAVCAAQRRWSVLERFPGADAPLLRRPDEIREAIDACHRPAAVVMSHDLERDRLVLGALLSSKARYIGVLGPRRRTERLLAALARPLGPDDHERLHAPAGLALGAETPHEIALSIVAEAQAALAGASAGHLRDLRGSIHAPPAAAPLAARPSAPRAAE